MRSPRSGFELACRLGVYALIGWLAGTSLWPAAGRRIDRASSGNVESKLAEWTRRPPSVALHGEFDATPSAWATDWLAALRHSGHSVTWSGSPAPLAMSVEPLVDPRRGVRVDIAGPGGANVVVRDEVSVIDSVRIENLGGSLTAPVVAGGLTATSGGESVASPSPDSLHLRSVVVVGSAGWEGKFIVAALEERGWPVTARFSVAPNVGVAPNAPPALDTSRVAAVIVVDTSLQSLGGAIQRFVRSGGGLVLAGRASASSSLVDLAPGSAATRFRPAVIPLDTIGLGSTGFYPVANLKPDAVVLERRPAGVAIAARRVGAGRVVQLGYDDSWRWRMAGASGSENAHRDWWARVVSAVAYAPPASAAATLDGPAGAPLAHLVDRLGPARERSAAGAAGHSIDRRWLLAAIMILLLAEWASRRLRGLK